VAAVPAARLEPHDAELEIDLVVDYEDLGHVDLVERGRALHREPERFMNSIGSSSTQRSRRARS